MLDETAVAVYLNTSSSFASAVPHARRVKVGLCSEDMDMEGSSKQDVLEETTPPLGCHPPPAETWLGESRHAV